MRRAFVAVAAIAALTVPVVAAAAKPKHVHFTSKLLGAQISATQAVYKLHDSVFGDGAGVQTVKVKGSGGTDSEKTYYGNGRADSKGTFKLGTPDANGVAKLTGSGKDTGGTGVAKGLKSTYTFTGTFNTHTLVFDVTLTGTYTL